MNNMSGKTVKTASKKIEKKITLVTSVLGLIIVNIIWVTGFKESESTFQPSITQKNLKEEIKNVEFPNLPLTVSLSLNKVSLNK